MKGLREREREKEQQNGKLEISLEINAFMLMPLVNTGAIQVNRIYLADMKGIHYHISIQCL